MSSMSKQELEGKLKEFVGIQIGAAELALDAVNEAMIRHWCDALGDRNPVYTDAQAAAKSVHQGIVAPPSMMQAWMLRGVAMADPIQLADNKQTELHALLSSQGFVGVVATNCEQGYARYLRPGDRISSTTTIESISDEKATGLGIGYFINTREIFCDQDGEQVAWQTFRVLKFRPHERPQAAADDKAAGAAPKPTRLKAPMGHDNAWWWEAVARGQVLIQKCSDCGALRHPARPMCASCQSVRWGSVEAKGTGTVYSYTVLHHPKFPGYEFPLACALVDLDEGVRMVSNLVGMDPKQIRIGMPVRISVEQVDEETKLPMFRPA